MVQLFNEIFYHPILNALVLIYEYVAFHDFGVALIILTIFIRLLLAPFFHKSVKDQAIMNTLLPKIKEIQKTHKDNREQQARALMQLYREHRVNPFSSFLLLLVQFPVLIALYYVVLNGFSDSLVPLLYSFVPNPGTINYLFLGVVDLQEKNTALAILASAVSYLQMKIAMPKNMTASDGGQKNPMELAMRQMVFIVPVITAVFLIGLPSAIALYLLTSFTFSAIQQLVVNKQTAGYGTVKEQNRGASTKGGNR